MDEFSLIRQYFAKATQHKSVALGIGDDCAVLIPPKGKHLAVSLDTLVEGVHFPVATPAKHIATRALNTALSDLAAMGAEPLWVTMGLTLPHAEQDWVAEFCASFLSECDHYGCCLVGGDLTRGPLTISVQVHGTVVPDQVLRRSGARPDDIIYVTGNLGDGAAGLALIQHKITLPKSAQEYLLQRFYRPTPRITEAQHLLGLAHSAIDISDGLVADLGHLCAASGVGAVIDASGIPTSEHWHKHVSTDQTMRWALTGGDDYELCFTVPSERAPAIEALVEKGLINAIAIGNIVEKTGVHVLNKSLHKDNVMVLDSLGYNHFG